jgi:hypothetical protein
MPVKTNRIELNKTKGLTIQVLNGVNTQTIFLDGDKIRITVVGSEGTSTIEQTPTSVTVTADNFTVDAKVAATIMSGGSRVALTPMTTDIISPQISLTASTNINAIAPTVTVTGAEATTVTAPGGELVLEGNDVTLAGTTGMQIMAPNIAIAGAVEYLPPE